ncbi:hypothetical protein BaRGS_00003267 [Batillaria attramentaria]|uniref:Alpha-(1,6)-fucosyltransferase n=1 Tax=Batillaria attramentaria TaxID=370345 RepID=A0ABD0M1N1_9CAEN
MRMGMKGWKVLVGLMATWLGLMLYMSTSLLGGGEGTTRVERQLRKAMEELETLHAQNVELQSLAGQLQKLQGAGAGPGEQGEVIEKLQDRLKKAMNDLEKLAPQAEHSKELHKSSSDGHSSQGMYPLSVQRETARRKTENTARELWYYINNKLKEMGRVASNPALVQMIDKMKNDLHGYQTVLTDDFYALRHVDKDEEWRIAESRRLGDLVQRRLEFLQNPSDCNQAKLVVCDLQKGCGFGCQLHHVTYCLLVGYAMQRTLVLKSKGWRYASKGWDTVFQPLSKTCTDASGSMMHWGASRGQMESARIIQLPIVDSLHPRPEFMPQAVPKDLAPRLAAFHGDPGVWWLGQLIRYLMRPNQFLTEEINSAGEKMQFQKPIVGVHIRRTDKIAVEAAFHSLEEYMVQVDAYYNQREHHEDIDKRRVYLATDDPSVLKEAREKYPGYMFISDNGISKSASLGSRYSDSSLRGIILDIHFLSQSDFLVCTFSSQVCRVAYELMQTIHGDASTYFRSLDDVFYFGGQNAHNMRAVEKHSSPNHDVLSFEVGDLLGIAGNHWDGFSKGTLRRTGKTGLYPSYKVVNDVVAVDMPTYPEVKERETSDDAGPGAGDNHR